VSVLVAGAAFLATGCSSPGDEDSDQSEAAFGDRVGNDRLPTTEPAIGLFDGYNTLFDLRRTPTDTSSPSVGQLFQQSTIRIVRSDVELAKELGLDTSFAIKAPLASAQGSAALLRTFKAAGNKLSYLIQSVQSYSVQSTAAFALTDDARQLISTRPTDFLVRCGDRFVSGVTYQAKIEALVTFESESEELVNDLQGSISGGGTAGVVELDGSIKTKLANAAKKTNVTTMMNVVAQGFDLTGNEGLVGTGGSIEEKLTRIDAALGQMGTSLRADRDRDVADRHNVVRNAIPATVQLTRYGDAVNAPAGVELSAQFRKNHELLRGTEKFLRAFGQLRMKMGRAYDYEIRAFQDAAPEAQASFNLMAPAAPKRFAEELRPIASQWADRFRTSESSPNAGTETAKVEEMISNCLDNAKLGDFSDCHPGVDPTTLQEHEELSRAIREYVGTGRIVKMRAFVMANGKEQTYGAGKASCQDVNGAPHRLPTAEEAALIAPLVAGHGGGTGNSVWISATETCSEERSGMPFFSNALRGEAGTGCDAWSFFSRGSRNTICVPQSGPVGKRDDL